MSQENVEVVRAIHEALARGESPASLGLLHPDIEYVNPPGAVEPGTRRGIAAYEDALRSMNESFEDVSIKVHEMKDVGDQVVHEAAVGAGGHCSPAGVTAAGRRLGHNLARRTPCEDAQP